MAEFLTRPSRLCTPLQRWHDRQDARTAKRHSCFVFPSIFWGQFCLTNFKIGRVLHTTISRNIKDYHQQHGVALTMMNKPMKNEKKVVTFPRDGAAVVDSMVIVPNKTTLSRTSKSKLWYGNDHIIEMRNSSKRIAITRMAMSSATSKRSGRGNKNEKEIESLYGGYAMGLFTPLQQDEKQRRIKEAKWAVFNEQERQLDTSQTIDTKLLSDVYVSMTRQCCVDAMKTAKYLHKELYCSTGKRNMKSYMANIFNPQKSLIAMRGRKRNTYYKPIQESYDDVIKNGEEETQRTSTPTTAVSSTKRGSQVRADSNHHSKRSLSPFVRLSVSTRRLNSVVGRTTATTQPPKRTRST